MNNHRIILLGLEPYVSGQRWESDRVLRIGRQTNLDVILSDPSVDRIQAQVEFRRGHWIVRDLADNTGYPTLVNRQPVRACESILRDGDILQFGRVRLQVAVADLPQPVPVPPPSEPASPSEDPNAGESRDNIRSTGTYMQVLARTQQSWDQALEHVVPDGPPLVQTGQAMRTLLRANQHLSHLANLDELLQSILAEAVSALDAQRGSILLCDSDDGSLVMRAYLRPRRPRDLDRLFSRTLTDRCFGLGESLLCRNAALDETLSHARSVKSGTMASIICALLRSPRKRIGVLHLDRGPEKEPFSENDLYLADAIAASVAIGIESAQLVEQQRDTFLQTVNTLARAVEMRDQYTGDHTRRVTEYSLLLAETMNLPVADRYRIQVGTPLHDIGKIGIDDAILRKPGRLTEGEFEFMKTHTTKGADILQTILNLGPMIPIVRHHHEKWDGTGYPDRLGGESIPQVARIVAVADAFDAMTSDRPYRRALSVDQAYIELLTKAGKHFDPVCVQAFANLRSKVEKLLTGG